MNPFDIYILGCGSALPTTRHNASSQVVKVGEKLFMIDCGEAAQLQLRKSKLHFSRLNHIFISHLHGDHCFGLPGLISTFGLLGRISPLHIYAQKKLEEIMQPQIDFFCKAIGYEVKFHAIDPSTHSLIYEDNTLTIHTIPLKHRIPCCGFIFREKEKKRHLKGDIANFYKIPNYQRTAIREGEDYITPEGETIPNHKLTTQADPQRSYAYCSDTLPCPEITGYIKNVNLLYHEATFASQEQSRAKETFHSTAQQAAEIAKLANVENLLLGHYSARYTDEEILFGEASKIFNNTKLAFENQIITIK